MRAPGSQAARRALKNRALCFLGQLDDGKVRADLLRRAREATNMTDHAAALYALNDHPGAALRPPSSRAVLTARVSGRLLSECVGWLGCLHEASTFINVKDVACPGAA